VERTRRSASPPSGGKGVWDVFGGGAGKQAEQKNSCTPKAEKKKNQRRSLTDQVWGSKEKTPGPWVCGKKGGFRGTRWGGGFAFPKRKRKTRTIATAKRVGEDRLLGRKKGYGGGKISRNVGKTQKTPFEKI